MEQSPLVYETTHVLKYYECNVSKHPSLSMLVKLAVQVSEDHGTALGIAPQIVQSYGGGWVITNYEGNFNQIQPVRDQEIIVGTKAIANNRFFALREFWITSKDRQIEYLRLTGLFVYMNLTTRKIMSIPHEILDPFHGPEVKRIPKLTPIHRSENHPIQKQYQVRFFDIDGNGHVNNTHYFDWMQDPLGMEFLTKHQLKHLTTRYIKEVRYGQVVTSEVSQPYENETGQIATDHRILVDGQIMAEATMVWE